jgi:hypothetical protein
MLARLLPEQIDNNYPGHVLALWLFAPLTFLKLLQGANVAGLFGAGNTRQVLETVDKVPISSYPVEAASHLVFMFAAWGLGTFLLGLIGSVALFRYRAMIPMLFLLFFIEQLGRKTLSSIHLHTPIVSAQSSPANFINLAFLCVITIGFLLATFGRRTSKRNPR